MSAEAFARFRNEVLADVDLQAALRDTTDRAAFVAAVVRVAAERGHAVTPDDVDAALTASRRVWLERWI